MYQADLPINASPRSFAEAISQLEIAGSEKWASNTKQGNDDYLETLIPKAIPGDVQMAEIACWLNEILPEDAIVCNGAGNYATWMHRFFNIENTGRNWRRRVDRWGMVYHLP